MERLRGGKNKDKEEGNAGNKKEYSKWTTKLKAKREIIRRGLEVNGTGLCRWFRFAQLAKGKKFRP